MGGGAVAAHIAFDGIRMRVPARASARLYQLSQQVGPGRGEFAPDQRHGLMRFLGFLHTAGLQAARLGIALLGVVLHLLESHAHVGQRLQQRALHRGLAVIDALRPCPAAPARGSALQQVGIGQGALPAIERAYFFQHHVDLAAMALRGIGHQTHRVLAREALLDEVSPLSCVRGRKKMFARWREEHRPRYQATFDLTPSWERKSRPALFEEGITGQQLNSLVLRRGIDDGIGRGELALAVQVRSKQGDGGVQRHDGAFLRVGDHLVDLLLAHLADQPLREFELHDGGHDAPQPAREMPPHLPSQVQCR